MEKLYTIPVNEAFDACMSEEGDGCPFCRLRAMLEGNELDLILGASMMEPDVRIKTNEKGFCPPHFAKMLRRQKRLPLALMMESHLDEVRKATEGGGMTDLLKGAGTVTETKLGALEKSCYLCERIDFSLGKMLENAAWLWDADGEFRKKTAAQPYFCLPHYRAWLTVGRREIGKKRYADFYREVTAVVNTYFDTLRGDVSWFCKKFDYRYDAEPWGNSKDSVERAIKFLCGGEEE